jgi:glucose dehydrogenase
MQREDPGHRPAPPREANDLVVTSVITAGWAIALLVMLILLAVPGVVPPGQRWWAWTCCTGVAMGLFGLWYVPLLQRNRARAAARHAAEAARHGGQAADAAGRANTADAAGRAGSEGQSSGPASGYTSRDNGSKTVSSTETPGSSTRS